MSSFPCFFSGLQNWAVNLQMGRGITVCTSPKRHGVSPVHVSLLLPTRRPARAPIDRVASGENGDGGGEESAPGPPPRPGGVPRRGGTVRPRWLAVHVVHEGGDQGVVPRQRRGRRPRRLRRQELPEGRTCEGERHLS
jgi:hypothetical protein